jgi:transposase
LVQEFFYFFPYNLVFRSYYNYEYETRISISPQALKRLQGGEMILNGYDNETIAEIVGVTTRSVSNWRTALKCQNDDLCALVRKQGSGRVPRLNDEQKQQLKKIIIDGAIAAGYPSERWTSKIVADVIKKKFDVKLASRSVRKLLPTLGLSPQKPVVKSHKHDEKEAAKWAKYTWKKLKKKQENSA